MRVNIVQVVSELIIISPEEEGIAQSTEGIMESLAEVVERE